MNQRHRPQISDAYKFSTIFPTLPPPPIAAFHILKSYSLHPSSSSCRNLAVQATEDLLRPTPIRLRVPPTAAAPASHLASPGSSRGGSGFGVLGGHAVPVGGSGGGVAEAAAGSPPGRKRVREDGGVNNHPCSVCGKSYGSLKALFGHMRKHPDRGWKGVHPPPTFRAEEEFADLRAQAADSEDEGGDYRVPDLNQPPPPDT